MNKITKVLAKGIKSRGTSSAVFTAIVLALVVFVNVIIYTLSSVFPLYIHSPEEMDFSISEATDTLFSAPRNSGKKVTVTFCSYEDVVENHATGSFVLDTARQFAERYSDFITLRFINIYTKLDAEGNSVDEELALYGRTNDEDPENDIYINNTSVIFSTETNYRVLTDFYTNAGYADFYTLDDQLSITSYNGEEVFASSVMWALREKDSQSKAYFTKGHGETANAIMQTVLNAAGYEVEQIDLRKNDVPEDAELLVISNPMADFEKGAEGTALITEYKRLKDYAKRGGNFYIVLDYYAKRLPVLEGFVAEFGIKYRTDGDEKNPVKAVVKDSSNAITADGFTLVADYAEGELPEAMKNTIVDRTDGNGNVIMREVVALELSGNAKPILVSSPSSVLQASGATIDDEGSYVVSAYSTAKNDSAEDAKLFFMFEGSVTSPEAIVTNGYSNRDFLYSLFDTLYEKDGMPYGCRSVVFNELKLENLTMGTARGYTAMLLAIPALLALAGAIVMIRRKNR